MNLDILIASIGSLLVFIFALERFHTPYINRYSTTASNFYAGAFLYSMSYLGVYWLLLFYPELLKSIFGDAYAQSAFNTLPPELVAALALTVLVPTLPVVRSGDKWIKQKIFNLVNVPKEVRLLRDRLKSSDFQVPAQERDAVRNYLLEKGFDEADLDFDDPQAEGFELTKITHLVLTLERWRDSDRFRQFGLNFTNEVCELKTYYEKQCPTYLGMARALQIDVTKIKETEVDKINSIIKNNRESCREMAGLILDQVYELIARALFSKLNNRKARFRELQSIGFSLKDAPVYFSWDVMAGLFLGIFIIYFVRFAFQGASMNTILLTLLIALSYCAAVFWATYPKLNWDFAKRKKGEGRRYFYYLVAMLCTFGTVVLFRLGVYGLEYRDVEKVYSQFIGSMPWQIISLAMTLMLCVFLENRHFKRLRLYEAAAGMVITPLVFYFVAFRMMELPLPLLSIVPPAIVGAMVSYAVPHWYRTALNADSPQTASAEGHGGSQAITPHA